jgi:hypothetical protein
VVKFILSALTLLSFTLNTATQNIEKAFLQNNPKLLYNLFSTHTHINVSLPEPIYFSDQLSHQQAYFVFKKIFSSYPTFEFYSEPHPQISEDQNFIYKARWSFLDKKTNDQHLFYIFFFLTKETPAENHPFQTHWRIIEIKAKKI